MRFIIIILFCCSFVSAVAQDIPSTTEQQLEDLANALEFESEDDYFLQQLEYFRRYPLNINTATAEDLQGFRILTDLQIQNFLQYRRLLGNFISIYELQAIPTWNILSIKKLLPYITISAAVSVKDEFKKRFTQGSYSWITRWSRTLETSRGYDTTRRSYYAGSPDQLFTRIIYQYKNLLSFGLTADKDAGEEFLKGSQKQGFDFYSAHLFVRNAGIIKALALGDYTVNMGQGLTHWQVLAFRKSADALAIKRQAPVLHPYRSAGEYFFNRGAAITLAKGNLEATAFFNKKRISTNIGWVDTLTQEEFFTSFQTSGFHRTQAELSDRKSTGLTSYGGNVTFNKHSFKMAANAVAFQFSNFLQKNDQPYNVFAINGRQWFNGSIDYSYTRKNVHLFGEAAIDKTSHNAFIQGALISVDAKADVSILYRNISPAYQSMFGNAFTENTMPVNENGLYTGIQIRPFQGWRIDAYADFYRFPFIKYRVDAPSEGKDYLLQLMYTPNKQFEMYGRFRSETKQINQSNTNFTTRNVIAIPRQNFRLHFSYAITPTFRMRGRTEVMWFDNGTERAEQGFLTFIDASFNPKTRISANMRLQYFETDGYNSRLYAYENDVLYAFSIPPFFDKGFRYYTNININITKKIELWLRWAQTIYAERTTIGSGLDLIEGNRRTQVRIQSRVIF